MKNIDLTIVCCYNKKEQLDKLLIDSLNKQNVKCQLILVDNTNNKFNSAAKALNYGASLVKTKYILFSHQDVYFNSLNSLEQIYNYMVEYKDSIIGVAGAKYGIKGVYTNILHAKDKKVAGENRVEKPLQVDTVDECLFGMHKDSFDKLKFDFKTTNGWHLYAADICYKGFINNIKTYVIPANIWHASQGKIDHKFFVTLRKLKWKYRKDVKVVKTCCIEAKSIPRIIYKDLKNTINKNK